jgi:hypothetical protein
VNATFQDMKTSAWSIDLRIDQSVSQKVKQTASDRKTILLSRHSRAEPADLRGCVPKICPLHLWASFQPLSELEFPSESLLIVCSKRQGGVPEARHACNKREDTLKTSKHPHRLQILLENAWHIGCPSLVRAHEHTSNSERRFS